MKTIHVAGSGEPFVQAFTIEPVSDQPWDIVGLRRDWSPRDPAFGYRCKLLTQDGTKALLLTRIMLAAPLEAPDQKPNPVRQLAARQYHLRIAPTADWDKSLEADYVLDTGGSLPGVWEIGNWPVGILVEPGHTLGILPHHPNAGKDPLVLTVTGFQVAC